jgi:hypothetical protein
MFAKLKWLDWLPKWLKAIFRKPLLLNPKYHFKAARPGDHFLSERPEKCVPMAGGLSVTFQQIVIHKIGKTLNSCIIKKAASHTPSDHPL